MIYTYDSIISWSTQIPLLNILWQSFVFTHLLMTASTILILDEPTNDTAMALDKMKQLRVIMYLMPLMFVFQRIVSHRATYYYFYQYYHFTMQWEYKIK